MLSVSIQPDPLLQQLMSHHPHVGDVIQRTQPEALVWQQDGWSRSILLQGRREPFGLVELIDNNPLVCADSLSLPDPVATLAMLALGPLIRAGILADDPTMLTNQRFEHDELSAAIRTMGWGGTIVAQYEEHDLDGVAAATAMAAISTPEDLEDLDALYDEAYGRSFYVRREEEAEWHISLVKNRPHASYRLRITPGDAESLLTIQVMADLGGKCGAAQIVHAFNVMCGFEESLGISDPLR